MLVIPEGASPVGCIVGIDPGSDTLGFAALAVNVMTLEIVESVAFTFSGSKLANDGWYGDMHGARAARIAALSEKVAQQLRFYQPNLVASESPFYSQFRPQAYGALTETVDAIRNAVWSYDCWLDLFMIDPPTVKKSVGARNPTKDMSHDEKKSLVKWALMALPDLNYNGPTPLNMLDEHSIDALAVAYTRLRILREQHR
jgi:Holliday junction resolvasome RuvABC endonuclease subunit